MILRSPARTAWLLPALVTACGPERLGEEVVEDVDEQAEVQGEDGAPDPAPPVPGEGHPDTIDVGSWNVYWFGDADRGPDDDVAQQANVARVLAQLDLD